MNMTRRHPLILALALLCGATAPAFATSPAMTEKPSAALRLATYNTTASRIARHQNMPVVMLR